MFEFGITIMSDPPSRKIVELTRMAEQNGFTYGWLWDSHLLWMEPYPFAHAHGHQYDTHEAGHLRHQPGDPRSKRDRQRLCHAQ